MVVLADRRALRTAIAHAQTVGAHLELRFHSDSDAWHVTLRSLPHVAPRTVVVSITARTEEQQQQQQQQQHEHGGDRIERFALRFPHAVIALRPDGKIAFANGRARMLLGRPRVRTGMPFGDGLPPDVAALAARLTHLPAPLHPTLVELDDGRMLRVSGLASTADDPAIMFMEDVTAQHRQELVTREFLRNAAHQLRTPIAGITAAVETLQAGAKDRPADRDRFLAHLDTHATRLTRIARGLLVLARTQAGEQLRVDFVELAPLLDEVARGIEVRPRVRLETFCEPGVAVLGSPELLRETLVALLENAVSHTDDGAVELRAAARDGQVMVSVTDSGRGILPEFRDRVFEPFYRIGDDGKGYGLGLAIAAQAVKAMDGTIDVSDSATGGTTFKVSLRSATVVR